MTKILISITAAAVVMLAGAGVASAEGVDATGIFNKKCAMCHAMDKKKVGPAVNAMNPDEAVLRTALTSGRKAMPAFGKQPKPKLAAAEIDALLVYIKSQQATKQ